MKTRTLYRISASLATLPFAITVLGQPSSRTWFERKPLTNWNKPGASIPKAPANNFSNRAECRQQLRNPAIPEERAVKAAGWILFNGRGKTQSSGGVVLVKGQESDNFDGMCRPLGYQQFVFVNGVFAGTISPILMNSRSDGNLFQTDIKTPSRLKALFSRYIPKDPACCASNISEVTYRIDVTNKKPLVVPIQVKTYANPR